MPRFISASLVVLLFAACSKSSQSGPTSVASVSTVLAGTVIKRVDAAPYSYLRVETDGGTEVWAAVPIGSVVGKGEKVSIRHGAALRNFRANRLEATLDLVVFGSVE